MLVATWGTGARQRRWAGRASRVNAAGHRAALTPAAASSVRHTRRARAATSARSVVLPTLLTCGV